MIADCVRHLFKAPYFYKADEFYIDWYVWDTGKNSACRQFILTYDVENRAFSATLQRSETPDDSLEDATDHVPRKLVDLFKSMLPEEDIARCTRASLVR